MPDGQEVRVTDPVTGDVPAPYFRIFVREGPAHTVLVPELLNPVGVYSWWEWFVKGPENDIPVQGRARTRRAAIHRAKLAIRHLPTFHDKPWEEVLDA